MKGAREAEPDFCRSVLNSTYLQNLYSPAAVLTSGAAHHSDTSGAVHKQGLRNSAQVTCKNNVGVISLIKK